MGRSVALISIFIALSLHCKTMDMGLVYTNVLIVVYVQILTLCSMLAGEPRESGSTAAVV